MIRYFWTPIIGWFLGIILCTIFTNIVLKIGWEHPYEVLLWGYAAIGSISVFAWQVFRSQRQEDREELKRKFDLKADIAEVKNLQNQIEMMNSILKHIEGDQEEQTQTVRNIYNLLLKESKK